MYDGSLYGQWEAIVTFQQMIVLCDRGGFIDMTPQAIAARTSIPLDIITKGIDLLEQPDKYSRTEGHEGRRIERIDERRPWGWHIVNYEHYRFLASAEEKREADRARIAEKRSAEKRANGASSQSVATCREQSQQVANVAYAEAEEINTPLPPKGGGDVFDQFWEAYPRKVQKAAAKRVWSRKRLNLKIDKIVAHLAERVRSDAQWLKDGGEYIPYPAKWLNGDGWLDEYEHAAQPKRAYV